MTTTTFTCGYSVSSDANFRSMCASIITALAAAGLVQTSDTGQIDTATVTTSATTNLSRGYAIFRFNDTAQATYPLFLKIEFGTGALTVTGTPAIWLTVGKGSDGAGNLSGILFTRRGIYGASSNSNNTGTATGYTSVASAGDGWVSLVPWLEMRASVGVGSAGYKAPYFHIERTNGGDGVVVCTRAGGAGDFSTVETLSSGTGGDTFYPLVCAINYSTAAKNSGAPPVMAPNVIDGTALGASTSLAAGAIGPVFPWIVLVPGLAPAQLVNILTYPGGDAPSAAFTSTINGVTRTYFPIPLSDAHNAFGAAKNPDSTSNTWSRYLGVAIRWD